MQSIRSILDKVFPKLRAIEEQPFVTVIRISSTQTTNPFDPVSDEDYDEEIIVPCIYSEQPEIISSNNNITTQQQMYFYIQDRDLPEVKMSDRFIFNGLRYKPIDRQNLFGLWKIKVAKE